MRSSVEKSGAETNHPLFKALKYYGIRVFLSSTSALLVLITLVFIGVDFPDFPSDSHREVTLGSALFIVLIVPALETLALAGVFYLVRVHISSATTAAVVAGIALAAMHSIFFLGMGINSRNPIPNLFTAISPRKRTIQSARQKILSSACNAQFNNCNRRYVY